MGLGWFGRTASYKERLAAWDAEVAQVAVPTGDHSLDLVIAALEKQRDRAASAIKVADDKAALVIPAVGVIAGLTGSNVRPDIGSQVGLAVLGACSAAGGVVSICLAIWALRPQSYSSGPEPLDVVKGVSDRPAAGKLSYAKSLGFAVQSAQDLCNVKAYFVTLSFFAGGVAVLLLTAFVALGGFAGGAR